jgi:hypothetical protein
MKSVNAFGVCGAAIIATSSALDVKHSQALPAIACDTPIVRWAATAVDGVTHKSALPPMSVCTPEETNCGS